MDNRYGITSIILAAGEGKRMHSKTPKMLHKVCGKALLEHVIDCAKELGDPYPVVVIGHGAEIIKKAISGVQFVMQEQQLGTGHAVMQADNYITDKDILILCGDTPLLNPVTLKEAYEVHANNNYGATILTADFEDPSGYGRIIRNEQNLVNGIVEHKDASPEQRLIKEINSGIYFFKGKELKEALTKLNNNNAQGEYYITDVIEILRKRGLAIGAHKIENSEEIMGVNNRLQLSQANECMRKQILEKHMLAGVTVVDPKSTYIDKTVRIAQDVTIHPGCILEGNTVIGEDCEIGPYARIRDCSIGNGVGIQQSVAIESSIGEETTVGPFAYIRPGNKIGKHARIGDFVEMKNSNFGDYSKVSHLTYVGDGDVGSHVNLGCGVVFVNYDGYKKNRTVVEDNCFIGCNVNLISPVKVQKNSYVAAGTTVTNEVPEDSLVIGRARQENKKGWVSKHNSVSEEK